MLLSQSSLIGGASESPLILKQKYIAFALVTIHPDYCNALFQRERHREVVVCSTTVFKASLFIRSATNYLATYYILHQPKF